MKEIYYNVNVRVIPFTAAQVAEKKVSDVKREIIGDINELLKKKSVEELVELLGTLEK